MKIPHTNYLITWKSAAATLGLLTLITFCLLLPILLGIPFLVLAPFIGMIIGSIIAAFILNSQKEGEEANKGLIRSLAKILSITMLTAIMGLGANIATWIILFSSQSNISYAAYNALMESEYYSMFLALTAVMNVNNAENPKKAFYAKILIATLIISVIALLLIAVGMPVFATIMAAVAPLPLIGVVFSAITATMNIGGAEDTKSEILKVALKLGLAIVGIGVGIGLGFGIFALATTSMPLALFRCLCS
jgi:hypothetical protein